MKGNLYNELKPSFSTMVLVPFLFSIGVSCRFPHPSLDQTGGLPIGPPWNMGDQYHPFIWIGKMMINHLIWWVFPRNFSAQARWFQCSASHPPSNHQANGAQHEATDAQGLRVEALDQQRAQRRGVAQHDDQRHGSRLESQNGGQQHALRNFFNFNGLVKLGKSKRKSLRI